MRELTITVPSLPPKQASPNWSPKGNGILYVKIGALKDWRDMVYYNAMNARNRWEYGQAYGVLWKPLARATITVTFTVPDRRYIQDDANAYQAMKAAVDEITLPSELKGKRGAGILIDDRHENLTWIPPVWEVMKGLDRRDMATQIEIKEVA